MSPGTNAMKGMRMVNSNSYDKEREKILNRNTYINATIHLPLLQLSHSNQMS